MTLEKKLVRLRKKEGMSQADVSEKLDVSRQAVSRWEAGDSRPSTENLQALCRLYNVKLDDLLSDEEISIGDYVLTGGEIPAMALIDSVSRYVEGVLTGESIKEESFSEGLLEYPQYTRPEIFEGVKVPEVLLSGHHENINKWRKEQAIHITKTKRPDLLKNYSLSKKEILEK